MIVTGNPSIQHIAYDSHFEGHEFLQSRLIELVDWARLTDQKVVTEFSVLDVGSGRGELLSGLTKKGFRVKGVDMDPQCVQLSNQYAPCQLARAEDIDTIFGRHEFDLVILSHILEHLRDPQGIVEKVKCISDKWVLIAVPNPSRPQAIIKMAMRQFYSNSGHMQVWDASHLANFLTTYCELEIVKWGTDIVKVIPLKKLIPFKLLRNAVLSTGLINFLETKFLPGLFPYLSTSLIVLCRVKQQKKNI